MTYQNQIGAVRARRRGDHLSRRQRVGRLTLAGLLFLGGLAACDPQPTVAPPTLEAPPPPPPPSGSFLAQLTPEQTAQLDPLGVELVVPGIVPPGFGVAAIATADSGYLIAYGDPQNRCFAVEFTPMPAEPAAAAEQIPISPPLFQPGDYTLNYDPPADSPSRLFSDWLPGSQGSYRLVGASDISPLPELSGCQNIDPELAVQVIEALTVISPDIVGDGEAP